MPNVRVLTQYCKGCGLCVAACPKKTLYLTEELDRRGLHVVAVRREVACTGCANCAAMCPDAAIEID